MNAPRAQGKNFSIEAAHLFKGLARHYGPPMAAALLPALCDKYILVIKRDAQAAACECLAGLVRGAGGWPLSAQKDLWAALAAPLSTALVSEGGLNP